MTDHEKLFQTPEQREAVRHAEELASLHWRNQLHDRFIADLFDGPTVASSRGLYCEDPTPYYTSAWQINQEHPPEENPAPLDEETKEAIRLAKEYVASILHRPTNHES